MKTHIEGGWVVAFNGRTHEVHERGSVVVEDDHVLHSGPPYGGPADATISAAGIIGSIDSDAVALAQQDAIIVQDIDADANATTDQSSDISQ